MMDTPSIGIVLDANVLVQQNVRNLILHGASERKLYGVYWTETILEETRRTLVRLDPARDAAAESLIAAMRSTFSNALVTGHEPLIARMTNHPKDRHVAAAAAHIGADIVTSNRRDFRPADLAPFGIRAIHADTFLTDVMRGDPDAMADVLRDLLTERQYRHLTADDFLTRLMATTPRFAAAMRAHLAR